MEAKQSGFTLIELVMVIVILGILAAVALPKFIDLRVEAAQAAVKGVAGSLGAASALNKAAKLAGNTDAISIANCQDVSSAMEGWAGISANYTITSTAVGTNATVNCTVTGEQSKTANFVAHGMT